MIDFISLQQASKTMGVSLSWLQKLVRKSNIKYFQEKGAARGRILISIKSMNKYFEDNQSSTI